MTDDEQHKELHFDTESELHAILHGVFDLPSCRANVLATLLRDEIYLMDDVEDLQDIFSMLGMMVFERMLADQSLLNPMGSA